MLAWREQEAYSHGMEIGCHPEQVWGPRLMGLMGLMGSRWTLATLLPLLSPEHELLGPVSIPVMARTFLLVTPFSSQSMVVYKPGCSSELPKV